MKGYVADSLLFLVLHSRLKKLLIILSVLVCSTNAYAVTNNLPDCSQTTVQSAINSSSDGDVLVCPAGSWSWSNVDIVDRNITLQGAGIGNTNISVNSAGGIEATSRNKKAFRITGFTFISTGNFGTDTGYALMRIYGGKGWRIDKNEFQIFSNTESYNGGNAIYTSNDIAGVIDHNVFKPRSGNVGCLHAMIYVEGNGELAWSLPSQVGSFDHTVFIEDNYFREDKQCSSHNPHSVYGQRGGIFVFRHNEVRNMNADAHGFEVTYSTREYEVSSNNFIVETGRNIYRAFFFRGGTGIFYNNKLIEEGTGTFTIALGLTDYRVTTNSRGNPARPELYGGVPTGSCCPSNEGYPCVDQIGRGQSVGTSPNKSQISDPVYIWGNDFTSARTAISVDSMGGTCGGTVGNYIQPNRDYYYSTGTNPKPSYTPYTYPHPLVAAREDIITHTSKPLPPSIIGVK